MPEFCDSIFPAPHLQILQLPIRLRLQLRDLAARLNDQRRRACGRVVVHAPCREPLSSSLEPACMAISLVQGGSCQRHICGQRSHVITAGVEGTSSKRCCWAAQVGQKQLWYVHNNYDQYTKRWQQQHSRRIHGLHAAPAQSQQQRSSAAAVPTGAAVGAAISCAAVAGGAAILAAVGSGGGRAQRLCIQADACRVVSTVLQPPQAGEQAL